MAQKRRKTAQKDIRPFNFLFNNKGMDEDEGVFTVDPSSAEYIRNMHPSKFGEYTTLNQGYEKLNSSAYSANTIDSLYFYKEEDGTGHFLTAINGSVLDIDPDDGTNNGTLHSANTAGNRVRFDTSYGAAYMVEKTMEPRIFDGTTTTTSTAFPSVNGSQTFSKPSLLCSYTGHMVYGNFNGSTPYRSHITISELGLPDSLSYGLNDDGAAAIAISPGDGQDLTGLTTMYIPSQNQEYLILFKERSVYGLSGDTPSTYNVFEINKTFGAVCQEAIVQVGTDVLFVGEKNIYSLKTSLDSGTLKPEAIESKRVYETLQDMNVLYKHNCIAVPLPERYEVWFGIPTGASSVPNKTLVYNYRHSDPRDGIWIVRDGFTMPSATVYETVLYTGSEDGYIRKWFNSSTYDGTGYTWQYRYDYYAFGTENQYKQLHDTKAIFRLIADTTVTVYTRWRSGGNDTVNTVSQTIPVGDVALYGMAVYGTDVYSSSVDKLYQMRFPVYGDGMQCQLEFQGSTADTVVTFLGCRGVVEFGGYDRRYN